MKQQELKHFGVMGMRWGIHRRQKALVGLNRDIADLKKHGMTKEAAGLSANAKTIKEEIGKITNKKNRAIVEAMASRGMTKGVTKKEVQIMSDSEVKKMMTKMNLEKKYDQVRKYETQEVGRAVVIALLLGYGMKNHII